MRKPSYFASKKASYSDRFCTDKLSNYKISFVLALLLHSTLIIFLFFKFGLTSRYVANSLINAEIVQAEVLMPVQHAQPVSRLPNVLPPKKNTKRQTPDIRQRLKDKNYDKKLTEITVLKQKKQKILQKQMLRSSQKEMAHEARELANRKQKNILREAMERELAQEKQSLTAQVEQMRVQSSFAREIDKYKAMLLQAIAANWIIPDGIDENASCMLLVDLAPGGVVIDIKLLRSSGDPILDRSAQTAVLKSSPLPVPSDSHLFEHFRMLKLTVRPEGFYNS